MTAQSSWLGPQVGMAGPLSLHVLSLYGVSSSRRLVQACLQGGRISEGQELSLRPRHESHAVPVSLLLAKSSQWASSISTNSEHVIELVVVDFNLLQTLSSLLDEFSSLGTMEVSNV